MEVVRTGRDTELTASQVAGNTIENTTAAGIESGALEGDFASFMKSLLGEDPAKSVNEEELFAAIIEERLEAKNSEAASFYRERKDALMTEMARADGYVPVEDVAKKALMQTADKGLITEDERAEVYAESFRSAQLDDNLSALYDGRGSANDPTVATAGLEAALLGARTVLDKIASGEIDPTENMSQTVGTTVPGTLPTGKQQLDGADGFLWKPESESDGNLVVLLPTEFSGSIDRVEIHNGEPEGEESKLEQGRFAGDDHNGNRAHFRFTKPGGDYGDNLSLAVYFDSGDVAYWSIGDGATRQD